MKIIEIRCESAVNPNGVEINSPSFSWIAETKERGKRQSAFQILVAGSIDDINCDKGTLWDSGKINSERSNNIFYKGNHLPENQTCYWKIRIWDEQGKRTTYSKPAKFTTSIPDPGIWQAKWIGRGDEKDPDNAEGFYQKEILIDAAGDSIKYDECSLLLRKEETLTKPVSRAIVHVCGLGLYELTINGKKVGEKVLNPAKTNYCKIVLYDSYDVSDFLKKGKNVLGIMLGNGWFNPIPKWWSWRMQWFGEKRALLQLHVTFNDGSTQVFTTDDTWKISDGPVRRHCLYDGEIYDATKEIAGWDKPGLDDSNWVNAKIVNPPRGKLKSQIMPAIQRVEIIKPTSVTYFGDTISLVDFGQNFSGWIRIKLKGENRKCIVFKYAEDIKEGKLDPTSNHLAMVTDTYISNSNKKEIYEPRFTYHGFKYVEVTGLGYRLLPNDIQGVAVHSAVEPAGTFECSNKQINSVHKAVLWSQRSNLMGYPTDCPQREERLGWLGDAHVTAEEAIYNFNMNLFYAKWLNDIKINQDSSGYIPYIAPRPKLEGDLAYSYGSGYHLIVWYHYLYYGDKQILADHYEAMKRYLDFMSSLAVNYILPADKYGDWASPLKGHGWERGGPLSISTGFYYFCATIVAKTAGILGYEKEAKVYASLADKIKKVFNDKFFNSVGKFYDDDTQFANSFALFLGIVPEEDRKNVLNHLVSDIINKGGHLSTGIFGTKYLMETLSREGRSDIAWMIASQTDYPGWINMIQTRTTLSEHWGEGGMNSHNHVMFGSVDSWFYKTLGGIQIDENAPGFRNIIINPYVPSNLTWVKASVKSNIGEIRSEWSKSQKIYHLNIRIPVGAEAIVNVITNNPEHVREGHSLAKEAKSITFLRMENNNAVFLVGSGEYNFVSDITE